MQKVSAWSRALHHLADDWCALARDGSSPVLHGFMRSEDVTGVLLRSPPGTFLFRFSSSYPGQLAVGVHLAGGACTARSMRAGAVPSPHRAKPLAHALEC